MMKKWLSFWLIGFLLFSGCSAERFRDNQVYVVDGGGQNQADDFVDWIDCNGIDPFQNGVSDGIELAEGEILLSCAPDGESYYVMQRAEGFSFQGDTKLLGERYILVDVIRIGRNDGVRRTIAQQIPFVSKAAWNQTGEIIAFCGGSHLSVYDQKKERLILQEELAETIISDFFWSPVDNNKMYIEQPDITGGGVYYVDPQKRVELYETREKIYYKAVLENAYYYATQWRSGQAENDGALYTVLADDNRKVIKIIGQGSYKDSYRKSVLMSGEDRFGLYYVADINQTSKGTVLTEEYVYDAKFLTDGRIGYIIRQEKAEGNQFLLCICDAAGKLIQTESVSGSGFYLSDDGQTVFISGAQQEIWDVGSLQLVQQSQGGYNDDELVTALRGAAMVYIQMRLGYPVEKDMVAQFFTDNDRVGGMALSEICAYPAKDEEDGPIFYQAILDRVHSFISAEGDIATCHIALEGATPNGETISEQLSWDAVKISGRWQVAGLSTFTREQDKNEVLAVVEMFLQHEAAELGIDNHAIRWRQVQYWRQDKSGLASWLKEAEWAKVDGEPGGLIVWLKRVENDWQVQQIWYDGGWVYPTL